MNSCTSLDAQAAALDTRDPLAAYRDRFALPPGLIYLDGNSLGPLPHASLARLQSVAAKEWGQGLIRSWGSAGWMDLPLRCGDRIAPLIGAKPGSIAVGDSTSVNLFKCLAAAVMGRPGRSVILVEGDNFPTDNYMAQGLASLRPDLHLQTISTTESIEARLNHSKGQDVAVLLLSLVDYRSSALRDMARVQAAARAAGAWVVWDLSHATGAVPVDLTLCDADFAVGCTYKYLNGGPGAPAFVWVSPRLVDRIQQPLSGWMGHAKPFAFDTDYQAASAVRRFVCGTPQVLSLVALDESLQLWDSIDMAQVRQKSKALSELFIEAVHAECAGHDLTLESPRSPELRGSHVSLGHPEGYAIVQAMIAEGVIGDFRAPNLMRFGFTPLTLSHTEVLQAARVMKRVLDERRWDQPRFKVRAAVT